MISQDEHMSQDGDAQESVSSVSSNDIKGELVHETAEASAGNQSSKYDFVFMQ